MLILKLEAHLIETNLHTGLGVDLRVADTSVLLCNSLSLVLSSSWKMVRWLMEIFSTLVMSLCPCIWTRNQTPKQVCFLCCPRIVLSIYVMRVTQIWCIVRSCVSLFKPLMSQLYNNIWSHSCWPRLGSCRKKDLCGSFQRLLFCCSRTGLVRSAGKWLITDIFSIFRVPQITHNFICISDSGSDMWSVCTTRQHLVMTLITTRY